MHTAIGCHVPASAACCILSNTVVRMQGQVRLWGSWSAASSNCNFSISDSRYVRQPLGTGTAPANLEALHLPILRFIEIQANAVSNWHPSFSAGFKVQLMFSSNAAASIKFLMPRYSKRKPLNVCIFCISSVMCQLTAIFGALP